MTNRVGLLHYAEPKTKGPIGLYPVRDLCFLWSCSPFLLVPSQASHRYWRTGPLYGWEIGILETVQSAESLPNQDQPRSIWAGCWCPSPLPLVKRPKSGRQSPLKTVWSTIEIHTTLVQAYSMHIHSFNGKNSWIQLTVSKS